MAVLFDHKAAFPFDQAEAEQKLIAGERLALAGSSVSSVPLKILLMCRNTKPVAEQGLLGAYL